MADSSPYGTSSADGTSSPIPNTNSSPLPSSNGGLRRSRRRTRAAGSPLPPSSPGVFRTPLSASRRQRQQPTPSTPATPVFSSDAAGPSSDAGDDSAAVDGEGTYSTPVFVWGTNISVQDVNGAIFRFLRHFRDPQRVPGVSRNDGLVMEEGKYMRAAHRILELDGAESLDVDAHDVFDYDPDLYGKMVRYPLEVLAIFDIVLMDLLARIDPQFEKNILTRIHNLKSSISMRNLNPSDIEKMVSVKGMIIRCSSIIPEVKEAIFKCLICCHYSEPVMVDRGAYL